MLYVNAAYLGTYWPHPPVCEYACGQCFDTIYVHLGTSCSTSEAVGIPHAILPSLPGAILP